MRVLGVSCDYHDAAAALVIDGEVAAAAEQERFSRRKHDNDVPGEAIASCLAMTGIEADDVDIVVVHEKPLAVFSRVIAARQRRGTRALPTFVREMPTLIGKNLLVDYRIERVLTALGRSSPPVVRYSEHHLSHAAAAFIPSPFASAAILTIDGIGEWATASIGQGMGNRLDLLAEQRFPHSLGLLYSLATTWCGFEANDGEYKLMGLAPYGAPRFVDALAELAQLGPDGSLEVDGAAVGWWSSHPERSRRLIELLDGPPRLPGEPLTERDLDLARSVQDLTERAVLGMARHAQRLTGETRICLAGGVALNCVANARLLREGPFDDIWVQPAAGDAGSAIGAALWWWHEQPGVERRPIPAPLGDLKLDGMSGAQLGPRFESDEIAAWLTGCGIAHERIPDRARRCDVVAERLAGGAVVGWFEGGMEFGPRALGHRSILADPRSTTVRQRLNQRIKDRESFRPFAPAVLWEEAKDWFDLDRPLPYMLVTVPLSPQRLLSVDDEPAELLARSEIARSELPACTHIDGSARVQTVHRELHPAFHHLLRSFHAATGCPALVNTSFNRAGEPIVCTPDDAVATARAAGLDLLVLEDCLVTAEALSTSAPVTRDT